jgi:hypothetical protein
MVMIVVQDRIEVPGSELARLQWLFRDRYMPAAAERGLQFDEFLASPPVTVKEAPNTLWIRWHVADVGAWWAMRAQSGSPAVAAFWDEVDAFCTSRERTYLTADAIGNLPQPDDVSPFTVATRGYRETAQLALREGIKAGERAEFESILGRATVELPGVKIASLGANFAPEYAAGHYTWDLLFPDRTTADAAHRSDFWQFEVMAALDQYCMACHALNLDTVAAGVRRTALTSAIKRTAYFRLLPGTTPAQAQRFEQDLLEMPAQIPQILNWRLSRAGVLPWDSDSCDAWSYVWEQEFASLDDLLGPYIAHPHHWAHIDRWFDHESGVQAVDVQLSHAFCMNNSSILSQ